MSKNVLPRTDNISILHLSDFHFEDQKKTEIENILTLLLEDIDTLNKEHNINPNFVVISGDIANNGQQSDYRLALQWLEKISERLKIPKENFIIVPGNHDIDRKELADFSTIRLDNEESVNKFLMTESHDKARLFKKLDNFFNFAKEFYETDDLYTDGLYFNKIFDVDGFKVGIIGLNSAWFSGENILFDADRIRVVIDEKKLILGETQAREAYKNMEDANLCVTVMHHPFSWLVDFDEFCVKNHVREKSDVVFSGHCHISSAIKSIEPDSNCISLSAGASYVKNKDKRYCIFKVNKESLSYEIFLRIFSEDGRFWSKDTLSYRSGDGILTGTIPNEADQIEEKVKVYPFKKLHSEIEKFIKQNYTNFLMTEEIEKKSILEKRKKFFKKLDINPSLQYIAISTIQHILENNLIKSNSELDNIINNSPFIFENISPSEKKNILSYFDDKYFDSLSPEIMFTSRKDFLTLKERGFLAQREELISKKIKSNMESEKKKLKEEQQKFKAEYELFKSEIDGYIKLKTEDLPKLKKVEKSYRERWYTEVGLKENPFKSHIGLDHIDIENYDDVVVKTKIYDDFTYEISKSSESLNRRSFLIYGANGSGKTTFFEYLEKPITILKPDNFIIFMPLEAQSDHEKIRNDFYQKLYSFLEVEYFDLTRSPLGIEKSTISESTISFLFNEISKLKNITNFVLFIDDIHKHPQYVKEVFEFIAGLQIFRTFMHKRNIDLTIFISGDLSWLSYADGEKAIGGSIDKKIKIPEITVENAVEMINKRLKLFALNPEKSPKISKENVEKIFKILKYRIPIEVTFRDIIDEVEKHWSNYEFDNLQLNVIYDSETLQSMALDIESDHPDINSKFRELWVYIEKDEGIFENFVNILNNLYETGEILESSQGFGEFQEYYGHLFRLGLISKRKKDPYFFVWVLNKNLGKVFEKFEGKYGLNPAEYLNKLYSKDELRRNYISEESSRLNMLIKTGGQYGDCFILNIKKALDAYKLIFKNITAIEQKQTDEEIVELCKNSILCLMNATLLVCERTEKSEYELLSEVHDEFIDTWFSNPDLTEFVGTIQKVENNEIRINKDDLKAICRDYSRALKSSVSNLQKFIRYNRVFTLDSKLIRSSDKKILNDIRRNVYNENYDLAISKVNELLANKLRDLIYAINCLAYSPNKWKRGLPSETNKKLSKAEDEYIEKTMLNKLSLIDLKQVFLNLDLIAEKTYISIFDEKLWHLIKEEIFSSDYLKCNGKKLEGEIDKDELLNYISLVKSVIEVVGSFPFLLFTDRIPFCMNYKKFGIKPLKDDKRVRRYTIDSSIADEIKNKVESSGSLTLNFSRFYPHESFQKLNFVDWIMYIYYLHITKKEIGLNITDEGKVIIK